MRSKIVTGILAVLAVAAAIICVNATRPLITAPKGTEPLDLKLDTVDVERFVVDEMDVLSEDMEKVICIYNANWRVLAGRVLAVVTVQSVEKAENAAWQWMESLSMSENDALLLIETTGSKKCALVSCGTFREDIATLSETYLTQLTYQDIHAGYFNAAVLAVFDKFHYFYGYDIERHRQSVAKEGAIAFAVIAVLMLPVLLHMIGETVDKRRFKRWRENCAVLGDRSAPWRTAFFWHRRGSKWYQKRMSGDWVDIHSNVVTNRKERRTMWYTHR